MADFPTVRRHLYEGVLDALGHARVVLVNGPRQAGKTTLVRDLVEREGASREYLSLDDAGVLTAARRDPAGFVAGLRVQTLLLTGPLLLWAVALVLVRRRVADTGKLAAAAANVAARTF